MIGFRRFIYHLSRAGHTDVVSDWRKWAGATWVSSRAADGTRVVYRLKARA